MAAEKIEGHLAARESMEASWTLKGWYKAATNRAPKASKMPLAAQTAKHVALYRKVASKGDPLPIQVSKAKILDNLPSDEELHAVVRELQNRCTMGT